MAGMRTNRRLLLLLAGCAVLMIGVAYACVPLYTLFCKATGFGGTTQRAVSAPAQIAAAPGRTAALASSAQSRWVTVTFDGNVDAHLPWDFGPDQKSVRVKLGEETKISYHARNLSDKTLVGTATYNVQPDKAGAYFDKIQCFCFEQQVLKPHEAATLSVQFFIDPALLDDSQTNDVENITLSYTFFLAKDQSKANPTTATPAAKTAL